MTTQESKQQYEGAILQQLIKNSERLVVVENDIAQLKTDISYMKPKVESIDQTLGVIKWILVTISLAIVANIFSQPILDWIYQH